MEYDKQLCAHHRGELIKYFKRIQVYESRELTKNSEKLKQYKIDIVQAYNTLVVYYSTTFLNSQSTEQKLIQGYAKWAVDLVKRAFSILSLEYNFQGGYTPIELNLIREKVVDGNTSFSSISQQPDSGLPGSETTTNIDSECESDSNTKFTDKRQ